MPPPFRCLACHHEEAEKVVVPRTGKADYVTAFVACKGCRVVLWPMEETDEKGTTPAAPDLTRLWGGKAV